MNDRITELETQFAFQEDTLAELNKVITNQQQQIDRLRDVFEELNLRLKSLSDGVGSDENEPPPHY